MRQRFIEGGILMVIVFGGFQCPTVACVKACFSWSEEKRRVVLYTAFFLALHFLPSPRGLSELYVTIAFPQFWC